MKKGSGNTKSPYPNTPFTANLHSHLLESPDPLEDIFHVPIPSLGKITNCNNTTTNIITIINIITFTLSPISSFQKLQLPSPYSLYNPQVLRLPWELYH